MVSSSYIGTLVTGCFGSFPAMSCQYQYKGVKIEMFILIFFWLGLTGTFSGKAMVLVFEVMGTLSLFTRYGGNGLQVEYPLFQITFNRFPDL